MTNAETVASFQHLEKEKYVLLTTFRRDGTPVPTPLWQVVVDGRIYTSTLETTGKIKRLRNNTAVTVSACTMRGEPTGPTYFARARLLSGEEGKIANRRKRNRYPLLGPLMHTFERVVKRQKFIAIEITPENRSS